MKIVGAAFSVIDAVSIIKIKKSDAILLDFILKKRSHTLIDKMNLTLREAELTKMKTLLKQLGEKRKEELIQNKVKSRYLVESIVDAILLTVKDRQIL